MALNLQSSSPTPKPLAPSGGLNKESPWGQKEQGHTSEIPAPFDKYPMLGLKIDTKLFVKGPLHTPPPPPLQHNIFFPAPLNVKLKLSEFSGNWKPQHYKAVYFIIYGLV